MNADRWRMVLFMALGAGLFSLVAAMRAASSQVHAQEVGAAPPPAVGRYQISAYAGTPSEDAPGHGCYVIDTATGKVWHTRMGAGVVEVTRRTISTTP